jgi:hypothetical protein
MSDHILFFPAMGWGGLGLGKKTPTVGLGSHQTAYNEVKGYTPSPIYPASISLSQTTMSKYPDITDAVYTVCPNKPSASVASVVDVAHIVGTAGANSAISDVEAIGFLDREAVHPASTSSWCRSNLKHPRRMK